MFCFLKSHIVFDRQWDDATLRWAKHNFKVSMSRASHNCVFPAVASSYHVKRITGTLLEWIRDHSSWRTTTPTTVIVFVLGRRSKCYNTKISTFWYRSLFVNTKQPVIVSTQKRTIVIQNKWIVYFIANCTPLFLGNSFIVLPPVLP